MSLFYYTGESSNENTADEEALFAEVTAELENSEEYEIKDFTEGTVINTRHVRLFGF